MKLTYHTGRNFGDALNPLIFEALLPGFFDEDERELFIGIGSIIGLKKKAATTVRRIYFSSGFAAGAPDTYGTLPQLEPTDDVVCVRGPLTAKALGLPPEKAVADGAILVRHLFGLRPLPTEIPVAYMPHVGSFRFYADWEGLLAEAGIALFDPRDEPMHLMSRIQTTGLLIAEAMHGAIIADAIGVPWIPVACYDTINAFKWRDFTASVGLSYEPHLITPVFDRAYLDIMVDAKLRSPLFGPLRKPMAWGLSAYHGRSVRGQVVRMLDHIKRERPFLSDRAVLDDRIESLLRHAERVRSTYGR